MRYLTLIALLSTLSLAWTSCTGTQPSGQQVKLRLTDQATGLPLSNVVVSVYDGFDSRLPPFDGVPRTDNTPYHFADIATSTNGTIELLLHQFKRETILLTAGPLYKYIYHKGNLARVGHFTREGNTLRVNANFEYDLKRRVVTVVRYPGQQVRPFSSPEQRSEEGRPFSIIDVPMD
jgi:hypothetical protein